MIIASHDLDCPWRPRDLEQRAGRTVRQGNKNKKVDVIRYVTEGTFDAYLYQVIENKQKIISQIMTSKNPVRAVEDVNQPHSLMQKSRHLPPEIRLLRKNGFGYSGVEVTTFKAELSGPKV